MFTIYGHLESTSVVLLDKDEFHTSNSSKPHLGWTVGVT